MKVKEIDVSTEKNFIIGIILDAEFYHKITSQFNFKPREHLEMSASVKIAEWIIEYYKKYKTAPGDKIERIFNKAKAEGKLSDDDADWIAAFLFQLSQDYIKGDVAFDSDYWVAECIEHFRKVELENKTGEAQKKAERGDVEGAYGTLDALTEAFKQTRSKGLLDMLNISGVTLERFVEMPVPKQDKIISPWLLDPSYSLMVAPAGVGKTWLCLIIASVLTYSEIGEKIGPWEVKKK